MSAQMHRAIDAASNPDVVPDSMISLGVLVWSLFFLWIYLNARKHADNGFFITILCGPAAWVAAIWFLANRPPAKRKCMVNKEWSMPANWRN